MILYRRYSTDPVGMSGTFIVRIHIRDTQTTYLYYPRILLPALLETGTRLQRECVFLNSSDTKTLPLI
jgi:hypothetical protein